MNYRMNKRELFTHIESTLLRPDLTEEKIKAMCIEAKDNSFASVMVNPLYVKLAKKLLNSSTYKIRVCAPVGFPYGEISIPAKLQAVKNAFSDGADEVDVNLCISAIKSGKWDYTKKEFLKLISANRKRVIKFVVDTEFLSSDEIIKLCELAVELKARYIVIGSAFNPTEVDIEQIMLIREVVSNALRVRGDDFAPCDIKVCGEISGFEKAINLASMGIKRIGHLYATELIADASKYEREVPTKLIPDVNKKVSQDEEEIRLTPPITTHPRINTDDEKEQLELVYSDDNE